jgi:hypothetical protein
VTNILEWDMRDRIIDFPAAILSAFLAGLLLVAPAREAVAEAWKLYLNARFGTAAEYPAERFHPGPPPDNGDGQRFTAADGAELAIFASYNSNDDTPATYEASLRSDSSDYSDVTYRAAGGNWLVLSGNRGASIFYEKHIFTRRKDADLIHGFVITYGRDAKAVYDPIAARIARTLHQAR